MPAPSVRPHPMASALGFLVILVGWLSVASYLGVRRRTLWRLATLLSLFTVAIVALVAVDALTRLQMFSSYAAAALIVVGTAWWSGDRERRESRAVVLTAVLLYPLFVGLAATGLLSMTYIRYAMAMPMLLLGTSMLVEGTLIAQRRAHAAAEAAVDAQRQLQRVVEALAEGSGQVAATGKTLSDGTQLLAMRTDEQTSHIRETAGAVRGVVEQVQLTSGHVAAVDAECQRLEAQARLTDANATMVAQSVMTSDEMNESARHLIEVVAQVQPDPSAPRAVSAGPAPAAARPGTEPASVEYF